MRIGARLRSQPKPDAALIGAIVLEALDLPFIEFFAQTDLDGDHSGRTKVTVTPGVRFNLGKFEGVKFGKDNWLLWGVDVPVAGPRPWDAIYRFTCIKNF